MALSAQDKKELQKRSDAGDPLARGYLSLLGELESSQRAVSLLSSQVVKGLDGPQGVPGEDASVKSYTYAKWVSDEGSDVSGDGTLSAPYATIKKAVEALYPSMSNADPGSLAAFERDCEIKCLGKVSTDAAAISIPTCRLAIYGNALRIGAQVTWKIAKTKKYSSTLEPYLAIVSDGASWVSAATAKLDSYGITLSGVSNGYSLLISDVEVGQTGLTSNPQLILSGVMCKYGVVAENAMGGAVVFKDCRFDRAVQLAGPANADNLGTLRAVRCRFNSGLFFNRSCGFDECFFGVENNSGGIQMGADGTNPVTVPEKAQAAFRNCSFFTQNSYSLNKFSLPANLVYYLDSSTNWALVQAGWPLASGVTKVLIHDLT